MKYLEAQQLTTNLSLGKSVEQWLGSYNYDNYIIIKWLRIDVEKNGGYSVAYYEVFDEGNEEFLDVYEFSTLDPDQTYGKIDTFLNFQEALEFAEKNYNSYPEKFVNAGLIQSEYLEYLRTK